MLAFGRINWLWRSSQTTAVVKAKRSATATSSSRAPHRLFQNLIPKMILMKGQI